MLSRDMAKDSSEMLKTEFMISSSAASSSTDPGSKRVEVGLVPDHCL